ncbi:hypothetical protein [Nocardia asteroides]|uniref:nSTAND3 domain-containing NTPase n=1 Tax=Nocardia asteroides TaxID=1824 RepID=UPI001E2DFF31|nr:hypothetical protein [Nocardia asteroides]UGT59296.1 hypothetical protein LTT61_18640 [Nocardia asteroides]
MNSDPTTDAAGPRTDQRVLFNQIFTGSVLANGANFGMAGGANPRPPLTGILNEQEIRAAQQHYVHPDGYGRALVALRSNHIAVLTGPPGVGKRTGAIALLRELTAAEIRVLSPASSAHDLGTLDYRSGYGYLVTDYTDTTGDDADAFEWRTVRDRVQQAGAWLVLTGVTFSARRIELVTEVPWAAPETSAVLIRRLDAESHPTPHDAARELEAELPAECTMAELVMVVNALLAGADPRSAVEILVESARQDVHTWFESGPHTRRRILEVGALAFLGRCNVRDFEANLARLTEILLEHLPIPDRRVSQAEPDDELMPEWRGKITSNGSLIKLVRSGPGYGRTQHFEFRSPAYRRYVIEELVERQSFEFWTGLGSWFGEVAQATSVHDDRSHELLAQGIVDFGAADFNEVKGLFLNPAATGEFGASGQIVAVYAVWMLCGTEALAPLALHIAVYWATQGSREQRITAAMAFSGLLGALYPEESTERLWHMHVQSADDDSEFSLALANLFGLLVMNAAPSAGAVLNRLGTAHQTGAASRPARARSNRAIVELLEVSDHGTARSAVFTYLHRNPDWAEVVAGLLAAVLMSVRVRRRVLTALLDGLTDCLEITAEPEPMVRILGRAVAGRLPERDALAFAHDLELLRQELASRHPGKAQEPRSGQAERLEFLVRIFTEPAAALPARKE